MLSADQARQLDRLVLAAPAAASLAPGGGFRHARVPGRGIEFQDYRAYQPGDDPRSIDWTIDARLRQLVVRVARAEGRMRLHLLVDVSGSMALGTPTKLAAAKKVAAALAYVAVERRDAVGVATFDEAIRTCVAPAPGRSQLFRIFEAIGAEDATGRSALHQALMTYGATVGGPGLVVVLSDFFHADMTFEGLKYLLYRGLAPALLQVVAAEELEPEIVDELELTDIENPTAPPLVVDGGAVQAYRERMNALSKQLEEFCFIHRLPWTRLVSSMSFDELLKACVQAGMLAAYA